MGTKLITEELLRKYYESKNQNRANRMAEETGLSPYYINGFLDAPSFRRGIRFLEKGWVWIHDV